MKTLHCSDAGFECKAVFTANTEEEVLQQAAAQIRTLIKNDQ